MKLKDRVAIVTGASRGIGLAIAEEFVKQGAKVVMADVLDKEGEAEAKKLNATYQHCDVSKSSEVKALVAATLKQHGAIDILVNNAAISIVGEFLEITEEQFDQVIGINLKGSFLLSQACGREMVKQVAAGRKAGAIVNMSSVNDTLAIPAIAPYTMSKGGVRQLTKVSALALAPHGIRVNAIGPGSIMTDMLKGVANDKVAMNRILSRTPLGRPGEASEIATIASFLASEEASYISGQVIYADGARMPLNYVVPVKE
ncbi:SDR family NAD(P)-dependent oxidoreductase [Aestuariivirga litoralis]|uniref:SDR family NAD(P)-dependent oxidoreductase n=1 Tax=Aestuariivirga litoralis TaxID=2650924 RepID=UPI0018C56623|nr:SDR family oxidoreductase [Aestuariivirga litoralis]MBG1230876.1 SDR family oxidoreductase [Aestuariivirga litoralis]